MPQVNMYYSEQLNLPIADLFSSITSSLETFDPHCGIIKIRAYPTISNLNNIYLNIGLKQKESRDDTYQQQLINLVFDNIKALLPCDTDVSININWLNQNYFTITL